jgi:hypothetical protein
LAAAIVLTTTSVAAARQEPSATDPAVRAQVELLSSWAREADILAAVRASNEKPMSIEELEEIDRRWVAGEAEAEMKAVLADPCADRLRALLASSEAYREGLVMNAQGALVCTSAPSSDYWQGDEAKWQRSFADGAGEVFVDRARYDSSARAVLVHISVPIEDGGRAIGVLTVGIDRAEFER